MRPMGGLTPIDRGHWVGLFRAGVQLLPTYHSQGRIAESPDLRLVGVVLRRSLFTYSYDLPLASQWLCAPS
jgi:hypothetical protein